MFWKGEYDLGCTDLVMHSIDTRDHKQIRQHVRQHPLLHSQAIGDQTFEMLQQGIIEPAVSE